GGRLTSTASESEPRRVPSWPRSHELWGAARIDRKRAPRLLLASSLLGPGGARSPGLPWTPGRWRCWAREDRFPAVPGKLSDLLWGPLFARGYDRFSKVAEDAGLRDKRRALLARAQGRTLEIGAGTGVNVELYPDSVTELVLTEPDSQMGRQLQKKLAGLGR